MAQGLNVYWFAERERTTGQYFSRLETLSGRLASTDPDKDPENYEAYRESLRSAEIDYHYCLLYPLQRQFRPPPSTTDLNNDITESTPHKAQARFWKALEKHKLAGTLETLKVATRKWRVTPLKPNGDETDLPNLDIDDDEVPDTISEYSSATSDTDHDIRDEDSPPIIMNINGSDVEEVEEGTSHSSQIQSQIEDSQSGNPLKHELRENVLRDKASEGTMIRDNVDVSNNGDAMMFYSSSNGFTKEATRQVPHAQTPPPSRVLADLSSSELNKQIKYFHIGKPSHQILKEPVRCLDCGNAGHERMACDTRVCRHCGSLSQHLTEFCPTRAKCTKCRELGHDDSTCPYKLRQIVSDEIICDICSLKGHAEEDCELTWRTSGKPWEFEYAAYRIYKCCYECGNDGHLGNDCPTRQPGKPLGSSTWSQKSAFDVPAISIQSARPTRKPKAPSRRSELRIRGRATNHHPRQADNFAVERPGFQHAPTLPRPSATGQIQIAPIRSECLDYGPSSTYNSADREYDRSSHPRSYGVHSQYEGQRHVEGGRPEDNHSFSRDDTYIDLPYRDRSRSPARDGYRDYYQPKPIPDRPYLSENRNRQDVYRPMPSSAQRAWRQHRL